MSNEVRATLRKPAGYFKMARRNSPKAERPNQEGQHRPSGVYKRKLNLIRPRDSHRCGFVDVPMSHRLLKKGLRRH